MAQNFSSQIEFKVNKTNAINSQLIVDVYFDKHLLSEFQLLTSKINSIDTQLSGLIKISSDFLNTQIKIGPVSHQNTYKYLTDPYLLKQYLGNEISAHFWSQLSNRLEKLKTSRIQLLARLNKLNSIQTQLLTNLSGVKRPNTQIQLFLNKQTKSNHVQIKERIEHSNANKLQIEHRLVKGKHFLTQIRRVQARTLHNQLLISIYNNTNLRILYDFVSRGNSGNNWSVIAGGTASGDFSVQNLNTDIVEQVFRTTSKFMTIQCDTEVNQGIFNDTVAILNHNFTTSAIISMEASNDVTFSTVAYTTAIKSENENIYWIAPSLPLQSYRYWRFIISDSSNASNYLQIGTIVFGSSVIFSGEDFVDEVTRRKTHFADTIRTEGFSSVSNDRALKKAVTLTFRRLNYNKNNYQNLIDIIDEARTTLKCLWIPTPKYSSRFAVFGKLSDIPVENHKAISADADYIDIEITVDEAL